MSHEHAIVETPELKALHSKLADNSLGRPLAVATAVQQSRRVLLALVGDLFLPHGIR